MIPHFISKINNIMDTNRNRMMSNGIYEKGIDKVAFSELNIISAYYNIETQQLQWNVGFASYLNFYRISTTISEGSRHRDRG